MPSQHTCLHCGTGFPGRRREANKFCGQACYHAYERANGRPLRVDRHKFTCAVCGTPFDRAPGELRSYRKQWGKDPLYCSRKCGGIGRRVSAGKPCVACGKSVEMAWNGVRTFNRRNTICSPECRSRYWEELGARNWREGKISRHVKRGGYVWISIPAAVSGTGKKREMLEHRWVMEQTIGRELRPEETVHHVNAVRDDNRPENLELFTSRHGPGARVRDQVRWAIELLTDYPDFAERQGFKLVKGEVH